MNSQDPRTEAILVSFDALFHLSQSERLYGAATDRDEIRNYASSPENNDATMENPEIEVDALRCRQYRTN